MYVALKGYVHTYEYTGAPYGAPVYECDNNTVGVIIAKTLASLTSKSLTKIREAFEESRTLVAL